MSDTRPLYTYEAAYLELQDELIEDSLYGEPDEFEPDDLTVWPSDLGTDEPTDYRQDQD